MKIESVEDFIKLVELTTQTYESPLDWRGHDVIQPVAVLAINNRMLSEAFRKVKQMYEESK